eukprot:6321991-Amphidinium_carterae.1
METVGFTAMEALSCGTPMLAVKAQGGAHPPGQSKETAGYYRFYAFLFFFKRRAARYLFRLFLHPDCNGTLLVLTLLQSVEAFVSLCAVDTLQPNPHPQKVQWAQGGCLCRLLERISTRFCTVQAL